MARFLYFVPDSSATSLDGLPDVHPKKVLAGANAVCRGTTDGSTGEPGVVVMVQEPDDAENPTKHGYYPDTQEWKVYPGWSLGWEKDNLPRPNDLAREDPVGGEVLKLGDGREWTLPLLGPAWQELPGTVQDKPDGGCEVVMRKEFLPLCKESEWWFNVLLQKSVYSFDRLLTFVSDALATNYHVGRPEVGSLGLVTTKPIDHALILATTLGMILATEESKKKREAGESGERNGS
jgi:hypothetical protein